VTSTALRAPIGVRVAREHVDRQVYRGWVWAHVPSSSVRSNRMRVYDDFTARWPSLQDWFGAPLAEGLLDREGCVPKAHPHGGASVVMPYLTYLSLVGGVGLDYELLLSRTFASPFISSVHQHALGVDVALFGRHVDRLVQLGYVPAGARQHLAWPLGRMLLHRGDPDLTALTVTDLDGLREAIGAFTARLETEPLRAFYGRSGGSGRSREPEGVSRGFLATASSRLHAAQVLLFNTGQIDRPPASRVDAGTWTDHMTPPGAPPRIAAVIERFLRLHLGANLDRPQTVRHFRDALHRLVRWLAVEHPDVVSLDELHRSHAEGFLRWLGAQNSTHTGAPLALTTRRSVITLLARFVNETAAWGWDDVPGRVLFLRGDIPKTPKTLPRFIPDHELAALMSAVEQLKNPYQQAALIVARWSGARRDEIRRLSLDCLDSYPDGHPRLRIPVGKGHAERSIPLHPDAADALRSLITLARAQDARDRYDPSAGRTVRHVFLVRGKAAVQRVPVRARPQHRLHDGGSRRRDRSADGQCAPVPAHRRHPARRGRRTPADDHGRPGAQVAGDVADLRQPVRPDGQGPVPSGAGAHARLGPHPRRSRRPGLARAPARPRRRPLAANFLKTELELGHCIRLPAEGPCECDLVLSCSKFVTTSAYAPRLLARLTVEEQLITDATERGWARGRKGGPKFKMTPTRVRQARAMYDAGEHTVQAIADTFGVSRPTIYRHLDTTRAPARSRITTPASASATAAAR